MKITSFTVCVLFFIGRLCQALNGSSGTAKAVQIIKPVNHTFQLELDVLKPILEDDDIKDRHLVVVSIAGAFRKGKSFLSNFFIRYLYAQYKVNFSNPQQKIHVSDWLGENDNSSAVGGFKWRGGQQPETTGIWMWSDIFTHDYENGEKIAIILLDTQGIFDSRSSLQDNTIIFALSMMLSSVQCYNVMQNIQENDLQHLELFTEYGRMVLDQTDEKPFQYLLFIIRDWPFADEDNYGWAPRVISRILTPNEGQTPEMHQLRQQINSSFEEIGAFLMPYPGPTVALKKNFTGNLKQIDPEFIKYVKELVPSIFAPNNLILKKINGEKVRARDLVEYLQAYMNVFNGKSLPEPKTVLWATAETSNMILLNDAVDLYGESMKQAISHIEPYVNLMKLLGIHEYAKNKSISQFMQKRKLGNEELISSFIQRIQNTIEEQFLYFHRENDEKRQAFIDMANLHNQKLVIEIRMDFEEEVLIGIENIEPISAESLIEVIEITKENALDKFDAKKLDKDDIANSFAKELQRNLEDFQTRIDTMLKTYQDSLNFHFDTMKNELSKFELYASDDSLKEIYQNVSKEAIAQFQKKSLGISATLTSFFLHKMETEIEKKLILIAQENGEKRDNFNKKAREHNAKLTQGISSELMRLAFAKVDNSNQHLSSNELFNLWGNTAKAALSQYDANKMGYDEHSLDHRTHLERLMNDFRSTLELRNKYKKSVYDAEHTTPRTIYVPSGGGGSGGGEECDAGCRAKKGALLGLVCGPVCAGLGAAFGALFG